MLKSLVTVTALAATISASPFGNSPYGYNTCHNGSIFTTERGTWKVSCGTDRPARDFMRLELDTFNDCIVACTSTDECVNAYYTHGHCHLRSSAPNNQVVNNSSESVVCIQEDLSYKPCKDGEYQSKTGGQYNVSCSAEYIGSDLFSFQDHTFAGCLEACDEEPSCDAITLRDGHCFLKANVTDAIDTEDSMSAEKLLFAPKPPVIPHPHPHKNNTSSSENGTLPIRPCTQPPSSRYANLSNGACDWTLPIPRPPHLPHYPRPKLPGPMTKRPSKRPSSNSTILSSGI